MRKRDSYRPEAHVNIENAQLDVLSGLASVLKHERAIPMAVTYFPNMQPPAESTSAQAGKGDGTEKPTNEETPP